MTIQVDRRRALGLGAGVALVGAFAGSRLAAQAATEFRIGWQKGGLLALVKGSGALEQRLAERGVTVAWSEFTSGPPLLEALSANALDFGTTGDVPPLFAHAARGNLVFVGAYEGSVDAYAILVPKDSPIQTVADLKGKRLAFKRGSSAHNVAIKVLRTAGLTLDDVEALDLAPPDAAAAFENGALDAWSIWDPYLAIAEQNPNTRVLTTVDGISPHYGFLSANKDFAEANPDLVEEVIDFLQEAGRAAQSDLPGTVAFFAEATGIAPEVVEVTVKRKDYDLGRIGFVEERHIAYEQELADEFHALGIVPRELDIQTVVWTPETAT